MVGVFSLSQPAHSDDSAVTLPSPTVPTLPASERDDADASFDVDQIHAQLNFLSVPTELVESTISNWILAPLDVAELAANDPFAGMNQPLPPPHAKANGTPLGRVSAGTEMRLPSVHKILSDQEAEQLLSQLEADERTASIFSPQLAFIDGMTATAAIGQKKMFVVGMKDELPQTRAVSQGTMVRLRTVLDDKTMWLDYEIVLSRILGVASQTIRVANRVQPITLAVPRVETTKAAGNAELPAGDTLMIGGLPAESQDGVPHQLVVLIRAGRMRTIPRRQSAEPATVSSEAQEPEVANRAVSSALPVPPSAVVDKKRRNPFSLISRMFNRAPKESAVIEDAETREKFDQLLDGTPVFATPATEELAPEWRKSK